MAESRVDRFANLVFPPTKVAVCYLIPWKVLAIIQHSASSSLGMHPPKAPERVR